MYRLGKTTIIVLLPVFLLSIAIAQEEPGFTYEYGYTSDIMMVAGVDHGAGQLNYLDNVDLLLNFNTDGLGLWPGGNLSVYLLSNQGSALSEIVGDAQVTSNIEADGTQRLYEFWYNQSLLSGRIELMLGMHDLNSEFYTNECASLFTNSSFGIGPDVSGSVPVSIFNVVGPAVRVKLALTDQLSILGAAYDGNPDADNNSDGLNVRWSDAEGIFTVVEAQYALSGGDDPCQSYRVAAWTHTAPDPETIDEDPISGVYFSIDQPVGTLAAFLHGGIATGAAAVPLYVGLGVHTPSNIGLAVAAANLDADAFALTGDVWEVTIEATWAIELNDMFSIQPDVQFVLNPSGNDGNAIVYGVRTSIGF